MPQAKDFFRRLKEAKFYPRVGQQRFWQTVSDVEKNTYVAVLATGYGKTLVALGAHLILRENNRIERTLVVCATDVQRTQFVDDMLSGHHLLGAELSSFKSPITGNLCVARLITGEAADLRLSWENRCEIFVTTVQSVHSNIGHYRELMEKGRWLLVGDEFHKFNMDSEAMWGRAFDALSGSAEIKVGMTATPNRTDHMPTAFVGVKPDIIVIYDDAYGERAVRGVAAHIMHYNVTLKRRDGTDDIVTTEDLRDSRDYDDYKAKRDLHENVDYLSSILTSAINMMAEKNIQSPGQHQMLIHCMSQNHAEAVAVSVNSIYGEGVCDWIGVNRGGTVNEKVMQRFSSGELLCMAQISKASEGFNNKRADFGVFLTLLRGETVRMNQTVGRHVRRNDAIEFGDDVAHLFAGAHTEAADVIKAYADRSTNSVSEDVDDAEKDASKDRSTDPGVVEFPELSSIIQRVEYDRTETYFPTEEEKRQTANALLSLEGIEVSDERLEAALLRVHPQIRALREEKQEKQRADAARVLTKGTVQKAVATTAAGAASFYLGSKKDTKEFKIITARFCEGVNTEWKRKAGIGSKSVLHEDLVEKHDWLRKVNELMFISRSCPEWLKKWAVR